MNEVNLKESIYNRIIEDILSMEFLPGQILNEKILTEKFNCSKSPVRDALQALCADGVLRSIPRYGYEVLKLTRDDIREMIEYRFLLESGMLRLHYRDLLPAQLARLEQINLKCIQATDNFWEHWNYNTEFHLKLTGACGNTYAVEELQRTMNRMKRAYAFYYNEKWDGSTPSQDTRHHADLLACLEKQDIEGAISSLKDDLNDFGALGNSILEL